MRKNSTYQPGAFLLLISLAIASGVAPAQLKVGQVKNVQHGTLMFQDDNVHMELSLSASAFEQADTDRDKRLSAAELKTNHADIVRLITEQVTLSSKQGTYVLKDIVLTPVRPLNSPMSPAARVVVQGKFEPDSGAEDLQFSVGLFGSRADEHKITMRVIKPYENLQKIFTLSPDANSSELNFD